MDLYTPSLPAIANALNVKVNAAQLTLSVFIFAVAISQFIYGILSDALGRKIILLAGILISLVGCILCMMANSIEALLIGRFIQGFGARACTSQWRAIFRDVYQGEMLAKMGAYLGNFLVFTVVAAPFLGGYLQNFFCWEANFFLTLCTLILLLMVFFFRGFK